MKQKEVESAISAPLERGASASMLYAAIARLAQSPVEGMLTTALQIQQAGAGKHRISDAPGLYLRKTSAEPGSGSWVFRFGVGGKKRAMGLGSVADVTLAAARAKAAELRAHHLSGADPLEAKLKAKSAAVVAAKAEAVAAKRRVTVAEASESYIRAHEKGWRGVAQADMRRSAFRRFAQPIIGDMFPDDVTVEHIALVVRAMAHAPEASSKLRGHLQQVFNAAAVLGQRDPTRSNPALWMSVRHLVNVPKKETQHHRRVALEDAPATFRRMREFGATRLESGKVNRVLFPAFEFMVLTATRPSEALGARWSEIDLDKRVWTIPGSRMKMGQTHVVPLSSAAVAVLEKMARLRRSFGPAADIVFPGKVSTTMHRSTVAKTAGYAGIDFGTLHGWRSVFEDWAAISAASLATLPSCLSLTSPEARRKRIGGKARSRRAAR
jgi:integrase